MAVSRARTTDSKSFDPERFLEDWFQIDRAKTSLVDSDDPDGFRKCIIAAFGLPENDEFVYHATASVTLSDVQKALNAGSTNGLHTWYKDEKGEPVGRVLPYERR